MGSEIHRGPCLFAATLCAPAAADTPPDWISPGKVMALSYKAQGWDLKAVVRPQEAVDKALVKSKSPYLAITLDGDLSGLSGYSVKAPSRDIEDVRYFTFQGKSALNIARKIGEVKDHVLVTVSTKNPATAGKNYPRYNSNVYPAEGASEAIEALFEHCPQD